jgi:hypothetical protein
MLEQIRVPAKAVRSPLLRLPIKETNQSQADLMGPIVTLGPWAEKSSDISSSFLFLFFCRYRVLAKGIKGRPVGDLMSAGRA